MRKKLMVILTLSLFLLAMVGCTSIVDNGSTITGDDGSGTLAMYLADKPVNDVAKVMVTLTEVRVHKEDGENEGWQTINTFDIENGEGEFDLLALRFDEALLGDKDLPAGSYDKIRLMVGAADSEVDIQNQEMKNQSASYVEYKDGTTESIFIPGGVQAGLQIDHKFLIEEGRVTELVLDADVSKIMHKTGGPKNDGKIILRRTAISVAEKANSGDILGRVVANLDGNDTEEAIVKYDIDGDDIDEPVDVLVEAIGSDGEVAASTVACTEPEGEGDNAMPAGSFKLRGLAPGEYTINISVVTGEVDQDEEPIVVTNADGNPLFVPVNEEPTVEVIVDDVVELEANILMELNLVQ